MITYREEQKFVESVLSSILEDTVDWIQSNLEPDDVFEENTLKDWAKDNTEPDDVFETGTLEEWAETHGYVKED